MFYLFMLKGVRLFGLLLLVGGLLGLMTALASFSGFEQEMTERLTVTIFVVLLGWFITRVKLKEHRDD